MHLIRLCVEVLLCAYVSGCLSSTSMSQYYYGRRFTLAVKLAKGEMAAKRWQKCFQLIKHPKSKAIMRMQCAVQGAPKRSVWMRGSPSGSIDQLNQQWCQCTGHPTHEEKNFIKFVPILICYFKMFLFLHLQVGYTTENFNKGPTKLKGLFHFL